MRVLLVDDSEDIRFLCRVTLGADPRFVVCGEAGNGEEAIRLAGGCSPDVILLDLMMPVMDGLTALPLLRELCPTVPIVVMTSLSIPGVRQQALEGGAFGVVLKSCGPTELLPVLIAACGPAGICAAEL